MPNLGHNLQFFVPCDLEIWRMTLRNNRAPLLCHFKLTASFHHHRWFQTGVSVWKQSSGVLTSVTLTVDLWPWPFAGTSLVSLAVTPENFMMIWWWEHSKKKCDRQTDRPTDGRTDRQTDWTICKAAWLQLKNNRCYFLSKAKFLLIYAKWHTEHINVGWSVWDFPILW